MSPKFPQFLSLRSSLSFAFSLFLAGAAGGCSYVSHSGEWQSDQERFAAGRRFNLPEPEFNSQVAQTMAPSATIPRLPPTDIASSGQVALERSAKPLDLNDSLAVRSAPAGAPHGYAARPFDPRADDSRAKLDDRFVPPTKPGKDTAGVEIPLPSAVGSAATSGGALPAAKVSSDAESGAEDSEHDVADNDLAVVEDEAVGDLDESAEALEASELTVQSNAAKSDKKEVREAAKDVTQTAKSATKSAEKSAASVVDDLSALEETEKAAELAVASTGAGSAAPGDVIAKKSAPATPECSKAEEEATRATSSTSDADRLFYFRRALRLCPTEVSYHLELGKIYSSLGRVEDAEHEFREVLEIQPSNSEAKQQLGKLDSKNS